jgi:hypothetical protein
VLGLFDWSRPFRALAVCLILIVLFAGLPVIGVVISTEVASALGCRLDEGNPHPCPFLGMDLAGLLYALFVSGWFGLLTIPLGAVLFVVWLIAAIAFAVMRLRGRSAPR